MQAAFLQVKLKYLAGWNEQRKKVAGWYSEALSGIPQLTLPSIAEGCTHVYHLYVIRAENRDALQGYLHSAGIGTMIHYPVPPHKQGAYRELNHQTFPVTERIHSEVLSLPLSPVMEPWEISSVVEAVNGFRG